MSRSFSDSKEIIAYAHSRVPKIQALYSPSLTNIHHDKNKNSKDIRVWVPDDGTEFVRRSRIYRHGIEPFVILIIQPPGTGKTTLLRQLGITLNKAGWETIRISMDVYYDGLEDVSTRRIRPPNKYFSAATRGEAINNLYYYDVERYYQHGYVVLIDACNSGGSLLDFVSRHRMRYYAFSFLGSTTRSVGHGNTEQIIDPAYIKWAQNNATTRITSGEINETTLVDVHEVESVVKSKAARCFQVINMGQFKVYHYPELWRQSVNVWEQKILQVLPSFPSISSSFLNKFCFYAIIKTSDGGHRIALKNITPESSLILEQLLGRKLYFDASGNVYRKDHGNVFVCQVAPGAWRWHEGDGTMCISFKENHDSHRPHTAGHH